MLWCKRFLPLLLATVPLSAGLCLAAYAAPSEDEQQKALTDARQRSQAARLRSEQLERQAESAIAEAERVAAERAATAARVEQAQADLAAAEARIALVRRQQREQKIKLDEKRLPLMRLAAALQVLARRPAEMAIAQPQSLSDLVHVRVMLDYALPDVQRRTAVLRQAISQSEVIRGQAVLAASALQQAKQSLFDRRRQLARAEVRFRQSASRIGGAAALEREKSIGLGEQARDIVEQMDVKRQSDEVLTALIRLDGPPLLAARRNPDQATAAGARANGKATEKAYIMPLTAPLASGLGEFSEFGYRARGLTLRPDAGQEILAPASGKMLFAGKYRSYGNIAIIDHGAGWTSLITGMDAMNVEKDAVVSQGQKLGQAGPMPVTIELRRHGRPMDISAIVH